jgi:hypothetical protein
MPAEATWGIETRAEGLHRTNPSTEPPRLLVLELVTMVHDFENYDLKQPSLLLMLYAQPGMLLNPTTSAAADTQLHGPQQNAAQRKYLCHSQQCPETTAL